MDIAFLFYILMVASIYLIFRNWEWIGPIYGKKFENIEKIKKFSKKHEKSIKFLSKIYVILFFGFMIYSIYLITSYFIYTLKTNVKTPGISLVIPGTKIPGTNIKIPLVEGIIAIFLTAFFHELSHAIIAIKEKINVNGIGFGFFLIFPVAFVDIDEKELIKNPKKAIKVSAAGPSSNLIVAIISLLILLIVSKLILLVGEYKGVEIVKSENKNLTAGEIIQKINGTEIRNVEDLSNFMKNVEPGSILVIETNKGIKYVKTKNESGKAMIGISVKNYIEGKNPTYNTILGILFFLSSLFYWIYFINYAVGMFNALPIPFLDGGIFIASLFKLLIKREKVYNILVGIVYLYTLAIIASLIVIPLLR